MGMPGKTIAVLGSGFNNIYPPENVGLFNEIIELGGLVISEYEPDKKVNMDNFPARNRIISGLSLGVLVVEASKVRSGAALTATIALEQGKKTFCIPCNIDSKNNKTNELILRGVKPIMTVETIIQDCGIRIEKMQNIEAHDVCPGEYHSPLQPQPHIAVPPEYKDIYKILSDGPKNIDEIFKQIKGSISNITSSLTMMEIEGLIEELPGKMFRTS